MPCTHPTPTRKDGFVVDESHDTSPYPKVHYVQFCRYTVLSKITQLPMHHRWESVGNEGEYCPRRTIY